MPLQGHWNRLQIPLRQTTRREGRLVAVVGGFLAVAVAVVLYVALQGGSSASGPGCIDVTAAHSTGGATLHACGEKAERWCRSAAEGLSPLARAVREQCAKAGLPLTAGGRNATAGDR
jgi:hypothetical protein